jgi:hypothetical protein
VIVYSGDFDIDASWREFVGRPAGAARRSEDR